MSTTSFTQQVISLIDQIEGRDPINCALAYRAISEKLVELYETIISTDTPLTVKLRDQIEEKRGLIEKHNDTIAKLVEYVENNKAISEEGDQLEKQIEVLEEKKKRIETLILKKEELEKVDNGFEKLDKTIADISLHNDELVNQISGKLEIVNSLLTKYSTIIDTRSRTIIQVTMENLKKINGQTKELLNCLNTRDFETSAEQLDKDLDSQITNYNRYVTKINGIIRELEELETKYNEVDEQYRQRFDKDKEIYGTLEQPAAINSYFEERLNEADSFFVEFESKIKSLVEERKGLSMMDIYKRQ
jgi:methyl-accepting chemotaxis protein